MLLPYHDIKLVYDKIQASERVSEACEWSLVIY